jgi:hypothetical protein
MAWTPTPEWQGQDAYIIGGGSSLSSFPFASLTGKNTIGCNDAFRLGPGVVKICIFGDASFFHQHKWELQKFSGKVVTCAPSLIPYKIGWLLQMDREKDGLCEGHALAWNYSTGAAAVNLAVILGATQIFLLGFDMGKRGDGKSHWHTHRNKVIPDEAYNRFIRGFHTLHASLCRFPHIHVYNVTDGTSKLPVFDKITFGELAEILKPKEVLA